jgi:hypothetical protein
MPFAAPGTQSTPDPAPDANVRSTTDHKKECTHMPSNRRRAFFASIIALFLVAATTTVALAFPKGHRNAADSAEWTGVRITDVGGCDPTVTPFKCAFTATSTASRLTTPGGTVTCNVVLSGWINQFGTTWIHTVTVTGAGACTVITASPGSLKWTNQFCEWDPEEGDSEYWDRVVVDFTSPLGRFAGPVFAQLTSATTLAVDHEVGLTAASILADGTSSTASYVLSQAISIVSVDEPCMWFSPADTVAVDSAP